MSTQLNQLEYKEMLLNKFEAWNWKFLLKLIVGWIFMEYNFSEFFFLKLKILSSNDSDFWRFLFHFFHSSCFWRVIFKLIRLHFESRPTNTLLLNNRIFAKQSLHNLYHIHDTKVKHNSSRKKWWIKKTQFWVLGMYLHSIVIHNLNAWSYRGYLSLL